jgi:hypothetical protein
MDVFDKIANPAPEVVADPIDLSAGSASYETITDAYNAATAGQTVTP